MNTAIIATTSNVSVQSQSQSLSECIKMTAGFLESTYTNICTGAVSVVPNGFWDFLGVGILCGIGLAFMLALLKMVFDY